MPIENIPRSVLSEHFQERLAGRTLRSAVFLTFRFEPDFFEQEVLPVLVDVPMSHASDVRLLQLEDALRDGSRNVAVYYDRAALAPGARSARLDVQRVAIAHRTGAFHPKNALVLTEDVTDDGTPGTRRLLVATMSANLTRAGWWENVEVCHVEDVADGEPCAFREDLLALLRRVRRAAVSETVHPALDDVETFVRRLGAVPVRRGPLPGPRMLAGATDLVDFLEESLGTRARGLCLEVISPYFDAADAAPLRALAERLQPREIRVFLPRADDGAALCTDAAYEAMRGVPATRWARLPGDLLRAGRSEQVKRRTVHAKVYRIFDPRRRYEVNFVGSVNLTTAAHRKGGNFESGVLLETQPRRVPDWWLEVDTTEPDAFEPVEGDGVDEACTTALGVRFDWERQEAAAFWDASIVSGALGLLAQGSPLGTVPALDPRMWTPLPVEMSAALAQRLTHTSFLTVRHEDGSEATILVSETGMAHRPSLLGQLSASDILRYWALLTPEQRATFLETRVADLPDSVVTRLRERELGHVDSMFDTVAGTYHSFGMLERHVLHALESGHDREAEYRLLGKRHDSLPTLLDRVLDESSVDPLVRRYLVVMTARQLVRRVRDEYPEFRRRHAGSFRELERQLKRGERLRDRFAFGTQDERHAFLSWFDEWFLRRAQPLEVAT